MLGVEYSKTVDGEGADGFGPDRVRRARRASDLGDRVRVAGVERSAARLREGQIGCILHGQPETERGRARRRECEEVAAGLPGGSANGGVRRARKKPSWPWARASAAAIALVHWVSVASTGHCARASRRTMPGQASGLAGRITWSQNACRRSTRRSGALPARIAALIAPIEMPAYQLGRMPASFSASYTPHW